MHLLGIVPKVFEKMKHTDWEKHVTDAFRKKSSGDIAEERGPADRGPRLGKLLGPRTAQGHICWTAYRAQASADRAKPHSDLLDFLFGAFGAEHYMYFCHGVDVYSFAGFDAFGAETVNETCSKAYRKTW